MPDWKTWQAGGFVGRVREREFVRAGHTQFIQRIMVYSAGRESLLRHWGGPGKGAGGIYFFPTGRSVRFDRQNFRQLNIRRTNDRIPGFFDSTGKNYLV